METNLTVIEWSPDGVRAYNPALRQAVAAPTVAEALSKAGSPSLVGLCLSRRVSFVREAHVPAVEKSELRLIVTVQLENLFQAVRTELAFDYDVGTHRYEDGVQTTVCATQAETLRTALKEVAAAGAKVAWVATASAGAAKVAQLQGHDDAIVVEQDRGFLNLDIVRHGMLVSSRAALDADTREARQGEVTRTLASYGLTSAAVIAVGDTDLGEDVRRTADGPLQAMADHEKARLDIELPEAIAGKLRRASQAKSRLALFMWLAAVCVGALIYTERDDAARDFAKLQDKASRSVGSLQDDVDMYGSRLASKDRDLASLKLAFTPKQPVTDVLTTVANSVPAGAWLTGVTFERGRPLQIRGTATDGSAVSEYTAALALDSRFRDVQLVFANNAEIEDVPVVQFAITAHVIGNFPLLDKDAKKVASR